MAISSRNPQFIHPTDLRTVILLRPLGQRYFSPLLRPDKRRDSTLTLFANSGFPSLSVRFFWWGSNPRTLNCFRLPHLRASSLALYRLSYRSLCSVRDSNPRSVMVCDMNILSISWWPSPRDTLNLDTLQTCEPKFSFDHSDNAAKWCPLFNVLEQGRYTSCGDRTHDHTIKSRALYH